MAYKINKTDGSLVTEIIDGSIDQTSTSITLIGKNLPSYGEFINENFVKILENFANSTMPDNPIVGQLWFDTAEGRIKVYDGSGFKVNNGPIVQNTPPLNITQGDLWIDNKENQLYFYDGVDMQLAGPIYTDTQGISGFTVDSIKDTSNHTKVIVKLWVAQKLIGIFSKEETEFYPAVAIAGFSGPINPGFNQSTLTGLKFNVTATRAQSLVNDIGEVIPIDDLMRTDQNTSSIGTMSIKNSIPLKIGQNLNTEFRVDDVSFQMISNTSNQNIVFKIKNVEGVQDSITVAASTKNVGIFNPSPSYTLDVNGTARIMGDLLIEGTLNSTSTNVKIEDKTISLANLTDGLVPTNITADNSGVIIKGDTDKTILWNLDTLSFISSEHINLKSDKSYYIDDIKVLSKTELHSCVSSATGITSLGTLSDLNVDLLNFNDNKITTLDSLVVDAQSVSFLNSPILSGIGDPIQASDASTMQWTEQYVKSRVIPLTLDITGLTNINIEDILKEIAPESNYVSGTECRILCTIYENSVPVRSIKIFRMTGVSSPEWKWEQDLPSPA